MPKNTDQQNLLISICDLLQAELIDNAYIEKNGFAIEVRKSKDYDEEIAKYYPDGFLHFPLNVEIDIQDSISKVAAAEKVGIILKFLWENNHTAIASCNFEELLPESGGYKSITIPWIR